MLLPVDVVALNLPPCTAGLSNQPLAGRRQPRLSHHAHDRPSQVPRPVSLGVNAVHPVEQLALLEPAPRVFGQREEGSKE